MWLVINRINNDVVMTFDSYDKAIKTYNQQGNTYKKCFMLVDENYNEVK